MTYAWSFPTTPDEVARRAGGRRHYNAWRQFRALHRRSEVARRLTVQGAFRRGFQARLARELGVSRATICRDVRELRRFGYSCPRCGAYMRPPEPLFADDPDAEDMTDL